MFAGICNALLGGMAGLDAGLLQPLRGCFGGYLALRRGLSEAGRPAAECMKKRPSPAPGHAHL